MKKDEGGLGDAWLGTPGSFSSSCFFFVGLRLYALSVYRLHMIFREQKILSSYRLKSWSDTLFTQLVAFGKEKKTRFLGFIVLKAISDL